MSQNNALSLGQRLVRSTGLQLVLVAGGTRVTDEMARDCHMDAGFGRGTTGRQVASFLVQALREKLSR